MKKRIFLKPSPHVLQRIVLLIVMVGVVGMGLPAPRSCWGQLATDQVAPSFALDDLEGRRHQLADARGSDLVILYFCDLESSSNRKGLARLNAILESSRGLNIRAFGITSSPAEQARAFTKEVPISFPLLIDTAGVIDRYHSHLILPTLYILDGDLMVSKVVLGGGMSMEMQLERTMEPAVSQKEVVRAPSMPPPPIRKTTEKPEDRARKLFHLAREENLKLTWDECLASKAQERARSLYEKGTFEHKEPGSGKNPAFEMVKSCARKAAYAGENLSRGMAMNSRVIHQEFMASSTHRQNIQNPKYSKMGVGCHETICVELFVGF